MDHSFVFGGIDKGKCAKCKCPFLAHLNTYVCDGCGKPSTVNLIGDVKGKHLFLCKPCEKKEIELSVKQVNETPTEVQQYRIDDMNARIELAREQDQTIRYSGDFFNAKVVALEEIRQTINNTEGLTADEKQFKFQSYLADRIKHLKEVVFELDEKKHQAITEELVVRKSLREMERELRADIRAKIKETDSQYEVKIAKPVKPRVKKETLGTYDRLVQAFMMLHDCSKEEAEKKIKEGSGGKFGNTKFANS